MTKEIEEDIILNNKDMTSSVLKKKCNMASNIEFVCISSGTSTMVMEDTTD